MVLGDVLVVLSAYHASMPTPHRYPMPHREVPQCYHQGYPIGPTAPHPTQRSGGLRAGGLRGGVPSG